MNNEVKEILDFKEDADYKRLSVDEITLLRDYITNLQEENKRLMKYKKFIYSIIITPDNWNNKNVNYELHSISKQDLYKKLYDLRRKIIEEELEGE